MIEHKNIQESQKRAFEKFSQIKIALAESGVTHIPAQPLRDLGKIDTSILRVIRKEDNSFRFEIKPAFVDVYLENMWKVDNIRV